MKMRLGEAGADGNRDMSSIAVVLLALSLEVVFVIEVSISLDVVKNGNLPIVFIVVDVTNGVIFIRESAVKAFVFVLNCFLTFSRCAFIFSAETKRFDVSSSQA